jgi:hypothetical protein
MVDVNPHIAIIHETRWIPRWFEDRVGLTPEGCVTYELIPLLLDHPRFAKLQIDREDLEGLLITGDPVLYETSSPASSTSTATSTAKTWWRQNPKLCALYSHPA